MKAGDLVRCIDDHASFGRLVNGAIYTVGESYDGTLVVIVRDSYCMIARFEEIEND